MQAQAKKNTTAGGQRERERGDSAEPTNKALSPDLVYIIQASVLNTSKPYLMTLCNTCTHTSFQSQVTFFSTAKGRQKLHYGYQTEPTPCRVPLVERKLMWWESGERGCDFLTQMRLTNTFPSMRQTMLHASFISLLFMRFYHLGTQQHIVQNNGRGSKFSRNDNWCTSRLGVSAKSGVRHHLKYIWRRAKTYFNMHDPVAKHFQNSSTHHTSRKASPPLGCNFPPIHPAL